MTVRAAIGPGYLWRPIVAFVVCLGFGLYSLYDGFYAYPQINRIHDQFEAFKAEHKEDWQQKWVAHAQANNLPVDPAERKSDMSILTQFLMAGITLPMALLAAYTVVNSMGRWMEMDETTLRSSDGSKIELASITQLDKTRWYNKGIAELQYQSTGDSKQSGGNKWVLDAWKYDSLPTQQMVREIQSRLKPEQVIGDKPKPAGAGTPPPQASSTPTNP